jgi:hypothetical protein
MASWQAVNVIETKREKCYTKSAMMGEPSAVRAWGRAEAGTGQKKARCWSGLNLSLEENRGDRSMMLHCKIKIQFIFPMTVINDLNSTAEAA